MLKKNNTNSQPLVSIIVATYNRAGLIRETISSILTQTYTNFELIIISDGSTDNTEEIIQSFADTRIIFIKQPPSGRPSVARNQGIRQAKGYYIAFCDDDDLWLPQKLELEINCFNTYPDTALIYSDSIYMGGRHDGESMVLGRYFYGNIFPKLLEQNFIPFLTAIVKKECLDDVGYFDESPELRSLEDYELWLRIAYKYTARPVKQILAKYRVHESNISKLDPIVRTKQNFLVFDTIKKKINIPEVFLKKAYAQKYMELAWHYLISNDYANYINSYHTSMKYNFNFIFLLFYILTKFIGIKTTQNLVKFIFNQLNKLNLI